MSAYIAGSELVEVEQAFSQPLLETVAADDAERQRIDAAFKEIVSKIDDVVPAETKESLRRNNDGKTCGDAQQGVRYQ